MPHTGNLGWLLCAFMWVLPPNINTCIIITFLVLKNKMTKNKLNGCRLIFTQLLSVTIINILPSQTFSPVKSIIINCVKPGTNAILIIIDESRAKSILIVTEQNQFYYCSKYKRTPSPSNYNILERCTWACHWDLQHNEKNHVSFMQVFATCVHLELHLICSRITKSSFFIITSWNY